MGTKVQCKSYLPGYYTMRDLNEDADSSWSRYYEDKTLGGHLYNGFLLKPSNRYSEYDRETLKRIMLEHEAIFRKQVYELHRLYRIQKDLMDEFQKKEPYRYSLQADTSLSNSFSSQIPSEGTNRMWQMPHLSVESTSYNRAPVTVTDDRIPPLNFLNGSTVQSCPVPIRKGATIKDGGMLDSKLKRLPRKMFDLHLPADVYIDCEDAERSGKEIVAESSSVNTVPLNSILGADPENDVKLTLGTGEGPSCREDSWKSDSHTQNGLTVCSLADPDESIKEICFEGAAGSVSANFIGPRTPLEENQLPMRSNSNFSALQGPFFKGRHIDEGTCLNLLHTDKEEISREWPFFNNEAGQSVSSMNLFSTGSSREKFLMPSESMQLKLKKPHEILSPDQNKRETWFKQKSTHGIEISGRSPHYGTTAPLMPSSFSVARSSDYTSTASPLLSSWTNLANSNSNVPLAVQSLQRINGMAAQNHSNPSDRRQYNGDLSSHLRLGTEPSSYPNGFNHGGFRLNYSSVSQLCPPPITFGNPNLGSRSHSNSEGCGPEKFIKDVNLNHLLLNGIRDDLTGQKNRVINDADGKCDDSLGVLSWLGRKPPCNAASQMELDLSQGYPQLKSRGSAVDPGIERREEMEKSLSLFNLQDLPSTSQVKESKIEKNEASEGLNSKRIFGFPVLGKTHESATFSSSHQEQSITGVTKYSEKNEIKVPSSENQILLGGLVTETSGASFRNHINLNSGAKSPEISAEGEIVVVPSRISAPGVASKIDLEAPIASQAKKPDEILIREAAENILWMSSEKCAHLDDIPCRPLSPVPFNTLHWFAGVVSLNAESVKKSSDDGLDPFELITLKLEETKADEYWCRPWEGEDQKDDNDGKSTASLLLFTKPRRGQARKRRQRRDFQKDIFPGLASLSRHEVTEDLQTIGGLMKASGRSWQVGGALRRNVGRNGMNSGARGRRQPRSLAISVAEIQVSPLPPLPPVVVAQPTNNADVEVDGRSMIGWGRTTRRCRRQRCLPVSVSATLT